MLEENGSDFNLSEMAETIGDESTDNSLDSESTEGQPATDLETDDTKTELSLEEITKGLEEKKDEAAPPTDANLLGLINALNLKRGEEAIQLKDEKEVAELIQKGFDYTKKTTEVAEKQRQLDEMLVSKEKEFQERFAQKEHEFSTIKQEQTILETAIKKLQRSTDENDRYLLAEISRIYNESNEEHARNKPFNDELEHKFKSLQEEIQSLKGQKAQEELGSIKQSFEQELSQVQTKLAPVLNKLKMDKVAWDKVQEVWKADATNKTTVEQAFWAVHGKDLSSAYQSHLKVLEAKAKKQEKFLGRTGASGSSKERAINTRSDDIGDYLMAAAENMG